MGKGLDALIPQFPELSVTESDAITSISIEDLRPNPYQPRRVFDDEKLSELADSIREHGIIQPLIVRQSAVRGFDIVAGERRFRAACQVGLTHVPAVVRKLSDEQLMEIAVIENLQREDLNAIEIADAYANLMQRCGLTQDQLAERVGQSRSHVANMLRLLQLPEVVREYVSRGTLTMGHARALLALEDVQEQIRLANRVVAEEMSVRKLEALVYKPKTHVSRETSPKARVEQLHIKRYEDQFRTYLGTSVHIRQGKKRGKIEIEYFSNEDLERILMLLAPQSARGGV